MEDTNSSGSELSRDGIALMAAWFQMNDDTSLLQSRPTDTSELVYYLCQALSSADRLRVERFLIQHDGMRHRLFEIRGELDRQQSMSIRNLKQAALRDDLQGEVARAWQSLVSERLILAEETFNWWQSKEWSSAQKGLIAGLGQAQASWGALVEFGRQWQAALSAPRVALARGAYETGAVIEGKLPNGIEAELSGEITESSDLHAELKIVDASKSPSNAASGLTAKLMLRLNDERWPLEETEINGYAAEWNLPGFGKILELPKGPLPDAGFIVVIGEQTSQQEALSRTLLAEVINSQHQSLPSEFAAVEILGRPQWDNGILSLKIVVPELTRQKYPEYTLLIEITITLNNRQRLGSWPIAEWNEHFRVLQMECPVRVPSNIPIASILRMRLKAPF